eukprot:284509_1
MAVTNTRKRSFTQLTCSDEEDNGYENGYDNGYSNQYEMQNKRRKINGSLDMYKNDKNKRTTIDALIKILTHRNEFILFHEKDDEDFFDQPPYITLPKSLKKRLKNIIDPIDKESDNNFKLFMDTLIEKIVVDKNEYKLYLDMGVDIIDGRYVNGANVKIKQIIKMDGIEQYINDTGSEYTILSFVSRDKIKDDIIVTDNINFEIENMRCYGYIVVSDYNNVFDDDECEDTNYGLLNELSEHQVFQNNCLNEKYMHDNMGLLPF